MNDDALILQLLQESRESVDKLTVAVNDLKLGIVGQPNCDAYRRDINQRLTRVEEVCTTYQATKSDLISESDLMAAKEDAIQKVVSRYENLETRMQTLEAKDRLLNLTWDTVKNNTVLKAAFMGLSLSVLLPAYGRIDVAIKDYGIHAVLIGSAVVLMALLCLWALINPAATKKMLGIA
jgi:hypothetical protein